MYIGNRTIHRLWPSVPPVCILLWHYAKLRTGADRQRKRYLLLATCRRSFAEKFRHHHNLSLMLRPYPCCPSVRVCLCVFVCAFDGQKGCWIYLISIRMQSAKFTATSSNAFDINYRSSAALRRESTIFRIVSAAGWLVVCECGRTLD